VRDAARRFILLEAAIEAVRSLKGRRRTGQDRGIKNRSRVVDQLGKRVRRGEGEPSGKPPLEPRCSE
jgi:hypothetical protein